MKRSLSKTLVLQFVAAILLISAPLAAQSKKDREQAKKLKESAAKAYAARNYRDAVTAYGQALTLVANDADAHFKKGYAHFNLLEYDAALTELNTALSQKYNPLE